MYNRALRVMLPVLPMRHEVAMNIGIDSLEMLESDLGHKTDGYRRNRMDLGTQIPMIRGK